MQEENEAARLQRKLANYIERIDAVLNLLSWPKGPRQQHEQSLQRMYEAIRTDLAAEYEGCQQRERDGTATVLEMALLTPALGNAASCVIYPTVCDRGHWPTQPASHGRFSAAGLEEARAELSRALNQLPLRQQG